MRFRHGTTISGATILGAMIALSLAGAGAAYGQCPVDPAAVMGGNGIDPAKVGKTTIEPIQQGSDQLRTVGYRLWLRGAACSGSVVFEFDRTCHPTGNYMRGDCTIEALKK